jgi:hypothetical protein
MILLVLQNRDNLPNFGYISLGTRIVNQDLHFDRDYQDWAHLWKRDSHERYWQELRPLEFQQDHYIQDTPQALHEVIL